MLMRYLRWNKYNRVHQVYQFQQNRLVSAHDGCERPQKPKWVTERAVSI